MLDCSSETYRLLDPVITGLAWGPGPHFVASVGPATSQLPIHRFSRPHYSGCASGQNNAAVAAKLHTTGFTVGMWRKGISIKRANLRTLFLPGGPSCRPTVGRLTR